MSIDLILLICYNTVNIDYIINTLSHTNHLATGQLRKRTHSMTQKQQYVTAKEAAQMLGISAATLYAYVSRGFIRSEAAAGERRTRRYWRDDVEALRQRQEMRRNPTQAAATALHFGAPVLESGITLIENGRFYYRGHDVLALARSRTFEEVAALIWRGAFATEGLFPTALPLPFPPMLPKLPPIESFQAALAMASAQDWGTYDLSATAVSQTGARIMTLLTAVATGHTSPQPIAATLQQAWTPQQPETIALFNAALILCADHELNVSAFTARCVASAASTPYGVVLAGLAALQGAKHGGHTERAAALFQEAATAADAAAAVLSRLRRGEGIPGFGHKLYPDGDPRARLLLQMVETIAPDAPDLALAQGVATAVLQTIGAHPTIDFGLVTLARVLHLPAQAALTLFALGRVVGWIGHALEQYQLDQIIRPRARYVGAPPAAP